MKGGQRVSYDLWVQQAGKPGEGKPTSKDTTKGGGKKGGKK